MLTQQVTKHKHRGKAKQDQRFLLKSLTFDKHTWMILKSRDLGITILHYKICYHNIKRYLLINNWSLIVWNIIVKFRLLYFQSHNYDACESKWKSGSHSACPTLWPHELEPARLLCPRNSPGENTGVGSPSLLQGIFLTQGLNPGLTQCQQILYSLSHQGSPKIHILMKQTSPRPHVSQWQWYIPKLYQPNMPTGRGTTGKISQNPPTPYYSNGSEQRSLAGWKICQ